MKRTINIILWILAGVVILPITLLISLYLTADMGEPPLVIAPSDYQVVESGDTILCADSYLRYDSCGLWELHIVGSGQAKGAKQGALTKGLMRYQEDVFIDQIKEIIPSERYLSLLRTFIVIFNRNLGKHIPREYRDEIAAMAQYCTHDYDAIGSPYERQLNYHAAHDIGHTMQQYMLVGCSSFGAWGTFAKGDSMVIGRNFDFYVGDDFAQNKLITFAVPDSGYRYASIGWAGMVGVLSGMNASGITVTINAAKGTIPTSAATPISILTREILQYASTIDEAFAIARSRKTFVSESILVGSATENRTAIIEKTPSLTVLYIPEGDRIISTNHFQSDELKNEHHNVENIESSDSRYRYDRLSELLGNKVVGYADAMEILRDRFGKNGTDVGIGNEMTINQSIAHHAVLFLPVQRLMWVSTQPWQSGPIVCYDLSSFFEGSALPQRAPLLDISADSVFIATDYLRLLEYRRKVKEIKAAIRNNRFFNEEQADVFANQFASINPNHYYTYRILADYFAASGANERATDLYRRALDCAIPYKSERIEIEKLINRYTK